MPAQPLNADQRADAARLKKIFESWQKARKKRGEPSSQEDVASLFGFGQSALSQYLNAKIPLNVKALVKFSQLLECRPEEISPNVARELASLMANSEGQTGIPPDLNLGTVSPAAREAIEAIVRADRAGEAPETFKLVTRLFPDHGEVGQLS